MLELLTQNITFTFDIIVVAYFVLFLLFFLSFIFMLGYVISKIKTGTFSDTNVNAEAYQRSLYLLDQAKKQSLKIYKDSQIRAKKIMEEAYNFKTDRKEDFDTHLQKVTQEQLESFDSFLQKELKSFEGTITKESKDTLKIVEGLSKDLKKGVSDSIDELKDTLAKETFESQKVIDKKIEEEYTQLETELATYKKEQIDKINDRLVNLMVDVSSKSLGISFSVNQHQEVILNVLEDAKKRDLLDF